MNNTQISPRFILPRMPVTSGIKLAVLFFLAVGISSCASSNKQARPAPDQAQAKNESFQLEPDKTVLVLPFSCHIQSAAYQTDTSSAIQYTHAGWMVFALKSAGRHAEYYYNVFGKGASSSALSESAPIAPDLQESPDMGESAAMSDSPVPSSVMAQTALETRAEVDQSMLRVALESDYDYVMTGNIVFMHTEVTPAGRADGAPASTVRCELSITYSLLEAGSGKVIASGVATGRAEKRISLGSGYEEKPLISNSIRLVMNRAMQASARQSVSRLLNREQSGQVDSDDGHSSDADNVYYQDSPGKRLRQ